MNQETGAKRRLLETKNRDLWQSELVSAEGRVLGRIVRQIIEVDMYTIRYFIVYCQESGKHLIVPSDAVRDIEDNRVYTYVTQESLTKLPDLSRPVENVEEEIYRVIGRKPYWEEEALPEDFPY
ncbi:MAG: hypothetical protein M0Q40_02705 [Limnochordia bacterium]|nr:hypothetical protein [Limnochordia bacterium]MDD4517538.1 hypothetical protein [Limnochordia bacterium]